MKRYITKIESKIFHKEINAIFWSIIVCATFISITGQYYVISSLTILFVIFGALLGVTVSLSADNNKSENSSRLLNQLQTFKTSEKAEGL